MNVLPYSLKTRWLKTKQWLAWRNGLQEEIQYWDHWLTTKGDGWVEDYAQKTSPDSLLIEAVSEHLPSAATNRELAVLDVGSGPITGIGFKDPLGRNVRVAAVDPLADRYNELLDRHGIQPPVRTAFSPAEKLSLVFGEGEFDVVHMRNALDHSYDPMSAIREMIKVTAPGGVIVLDHFVNEAKHTGYAGLHQFNMDYRDGRFVIWNPGTAVDVQAALGDAVMIECKPYTIGRDWIQVIMKKKTLSLH